ncbi:MAG: hypothetical protein EXS09_18800, partial [Gemmataceae bacterium]|nr:hypothetical protein [Gemmataceae bacterium]
MRHSFATLILLAVSFPAFAEPKAGRTEFTRLIAHWAEYADEDYLKFVAEAHPEICQIGFYGG